MAQPKLRFKREDGTEFPEWKEYLLQDISSYVTVTGGGNKSAFIGTENMKKGCMGVLFDTDVYSEVKGVKFQTNDILVSNIRPYLKKAWKADRNGICSTDVLCIRGNSGIDSDFLYAIIANDRFFDYVMQGVKGTKMPRGDKKHIMDMPVAIPCLEEQQKIADFLSTADEIIAQSEAEVQNLEQQKKAAMQKIFSQEVRFRREDGTKYPEWEEKALSSICKNIVVGYVGECDSYYTDKCGVIMLRTGNLQNGILDDSELKYVTQSFHFSHKKSQVFNGDLLIARHGSNGQAVLFDKAYPANTLNIVIVRPNSDLIFSKYLLYIINSSYVNRQVSQVTAGSTQKVINTSEIEKLIVLYPCLEEQQKIADCFSAYDEAISYAKQELDKWKKLKKGLLQQMFV